MELINELITMLFVNQPNLSIAPLRQEGSIEPWCLPSVEDQGFQRGFVCLLLSICESKFTDLLIKEI